MQVIYKMKVRLFNIPTFNEWVANSKKIIGGCMNSNYEIKEGVLTVCLEEELDHHNVENIRNNIDEIILKNEVRDIVFDFKKTTFMDSSGIGLILGRYRMLKTVGGKIKVKNSGVNIERILMVSGLYKIVERI